MTDTGRFGRREFLAGAGAGLAVAATGGGLPRAARAARLHRKGDLERVEHIVIFMQENISFDHYFGTLAGVAGFSDPNAIKLPNGNSVFEQPYPLTSDGFLRPWHFDQDKQNPCRVLVNNAWSDRHNAWNGGKMDGFIGATGGLPNYYTMAYYDRSDLAWHMGLADAFTVCDRYFCSVLGPTNPNRLMMWTGTIDPEGKNGGPDYDNQAYSKSDTRYTWKTYPERLTEAGVTWRVYHETDDFDDNALKYFAAYQDAKPGSPLYENAMKNRAADAFMDDVAHDRLPQVSWIVAPTRVSEHQLVSSPGLGAAYNAAVVGAFAKNPKLWRKTALIFCYDEDGGYFDHVPPPTPPAGTKDEFIGDEPIGLGFRVPAVICSPWTRGRFVCSQTYDHTSLIRFLERRFGVIEPQISAWRRKMCGDLWEAFDFAAPDYSFPTLPNGKTDSALADQRCRDNAVAAPRTTNDPQPKQEPGTRERRPCATHGTPAVVTLPAAAKRLSGSITVNGRGKRRLSARELRRGRVVLRGLPAGSTALVRITLQVRTRSGRRRTLHLRRTVAARCAA